MKYDKACVTVMIADMLLKCRINQPLQLTNLHDLQYHNSNICKQNLDKFLGERVHIECADAFQIQTL